MSNSYCFLPVALFRLRTLELYQVFSLKIPLAAGKSRRRMRDLKGSNSCRITAVADDSTDGNEVEEWFKFKTNLFLPLTVHLPLLQLSLLTTVCCVRVLPLFKPTLCQFFFFH